VVRRPLGFIAVLAALMATGMGVLYAAGGTLGPLDGRAYPEYALRPLLWNTAVAIDFAGQPFGAAMLITTLAAACLVLRRPRTAVLAVAGTGPTVAVTTVAKPLVGRRIHEAYLAYPSGHSALLTAFALVLALLLVDLVRPRRRAALLVGAAAVLAGAIMAWSQIGLSAHYPTDTIGGFCVALAVVPAAAWLVDHVSDRICGRIALRIETERLPQPVPVTNRPIDPNIPAARQPPRRPLS
jgi:undecaprenyl-diphosphatase